MSVSRIKPCTLHARTDLRRQRASGSRRCLYTAYDGTMFACFDQKVFRIDDQNQFAEMGTFTPTDPTDAVAKDTPVSMSDNGQILLIADGSVDGWFIDLTQAKADQKLQQIDRDLNQGWLGADYISFQDTFFILNKPNSAQFYISLSNMSATNLTAEFSVQAATIYKVLGVSLDPVNGVPGTQGADYKVGDVLTLINTGNATVTVNTVSSGGAILTATVTDRGASQSSHPTRCSPPVAAEPAPALMSAIAVIPAPGISPATL